MCGIAGILQINGRLNVSSLLRMTGIQAHRGPDDEGYMLGNFHEGRAAVYCGAATPGQVKQSTHVFCPTVELEDQSSGDWSLGFGHRRLSILDLSPGGHQPMCTPDRKLWIVFNGEIYNYKELRDELKALGCVFNSQSDTEVILNAYQQWGPQCLGHLNGMWGFAIWDTTKHLLFCARDRFGVKPFYYIYDGARFAFASEIKALLELGVLRKANTDLVFDYLVYGLLDHTSETFFEGIHKLPQGQYIILRESGECEIERWWQLSVSEEFSSTRPDTIYEDEFRALFGDAVRLRLRSDVPVGSCLSGGLDSSSIVCVATNILKEAGNANAPRMETFSSCFEQRSIDERCYIDEVIRVTGAGRNYVFPTNEAFLTDLEHLIHCQEEPFNGTGIYAQWLVFKAAREKGVVVLLDGQGADEQLAGYWKFVFFYMMNLWNSGRRFDSFQESLKFFASLEVIRNLPIRKGLKYLKWGRHFEGISSLLRNSFVQRYSMRSYDLFSAKNLAHRLHDDIFLYSLPVLLRYEDRNSMFHSLETRLPYLDVNLAEGVAGMPLNQKIRGWRKHILRAAMRGILPERVRLRRSKLGFSTPEDQWVRSALQSDGLHSLEKAEFISSFVDTQRVARSAHHFLHHTSRFSATTYFRLLLLERWGRHFGLCG